MYKERRTNICHHCECIQIIRSNEFKFKRIDNGIKSLSLSISTNAEHKYPNTQKGTVLLENDTLELTVRVE